MCWYPLWDLSNSNQTNQATDNGNISQSEAVNEPENTENSCWENQIGETIQGAVYIDLKEWLIIDETGHTTDIDQ